MVHLRTQIADAVVAVLAGLDGFTEAGKVDYGAGHTVRQEKLPQLRVSWAADPEAAAVRPFAAADGSFGYDRSLVLGVFVHLRNADPEREFDALAALIEPAMAADETLGGLAVECLLEASQLFTNAETGVPLGIGRLDYRISYKSEKNPAVQAL